MWWLVALINNLDGVIRCLAERLGVLALSNKAIISCDGNFKQVHRRHKAGVKKDSSVGDVYFVKSTDPTFDGILRPMDDDTRDFDDCNNFAATALRNHTFSSTNDVNGILGAYCKHSLPVPKSFSNIERGEAYVFMHFLR